MNAMTTTTPGTSVAVSTGGLDPFAQAAKDLGIQEGNFLKFNGNTGDFTYGIGDGEELVHGTQLAVNMSDFEQGFICWKDGDVEDERMVGILAGPKPIAEALPDHGPYTTYDDGTKDGWSEQVKLILRNVEDGNVYTFKSTSKSGLRGVGKLLKDYAKVYKSNPGAFPVVEISSVTFEPKVQDGKKKVGKKHAPVFTLKGWMPGADYDALVAMAPEPSAAKDEGQDDAANYSDASPTDQNPTDNPPAEEKQVENKAADAAPATGGRRNKRF